MRWLRAVPVSLGCHFIPVCSFPRRPADLSGWGPPPPAGMAPPWARSGGRGAERHRAGKVASPQLWDLRRTDGGGGGEDGAGWGDGHNKGASTAHRASLSFSATTNPTMNHVAETATTTFLGTASAWPPLLRTALA